MVPPRRVPVKMPITPELGRSLLKAAIDSTKSSPAINSTKPSLNQDTPVALSPDSAIVISSADDSKKASRDRWRPLRRRGTMICGHTVDVLTSKVLDLYGG